MSWFSKLNPTPVFPDYTGPYKVGSVDVEIPVAELSAPSPAPDSSIGTVAFRIFYPCDSDSARRPVRWLPGPQKEHLAAYMRFLGANHSLSNVLALLPQHLYYITVPVQRNAPLAPTNDQSARWPVMVFSHGLGGSRNAYSHLCGSIASHGVVIIAPDHRDGSAPVSFVRATEGFEAKTLKYTSYPHEASEEVYKARDEMLKVRLWELGLIHDALLKIDEGKPVKNLDPNSVQSRKKDFNDVLSMFKGRIDVQTPGAIAWAGHSFGAATMHQLVKSVYYRPDSEKAGYAPLFTPGSSSAIVKQITPSSLLTLLDMWCLPLKSPSTHWLWKKPLPCYAASGPGGKAIIAICSEDFFKWKEHLSETKRALSEAPASDAPPHTKSPPFFFYPVHSAHLSQSDFGILFPWATKKMFNSVEPEWTLELNVRAVLQFLRENEWKIAETLLPAEEIDSQAATNGSAASVDRRGLDPKILHPSSNVKNWIYITTDQGTADLIKREDSPGPGAVKDVVQREVLTDVTKKPSRWHRSKSGSPFQRSKSSDSVEPAGKAENNQQGVRLWTSVVAKPAPADDAKPKVESGADAKDGAKDKRPGKQIRRISFRRGLTYA